MWRYVYYVPALSAESMRSSRLKEAASPTLAALIDIYAGNMSNTAEVVIEEDFAKNITKFGLEAIREWCKTQRASSVWKTLGRWLSTKRRCRRTSRT